MAQVLVVDNDAAYCGVPIQDFVASDKLQLNIYIRLSPTKYLRVAHKGDHMTPDRVENYKKKGVSFLYARKDDYVRLIEFSVDTSKPGEKSAAAQEKKAHFMRYTTELIVNQLLVSGVDKESFDLAKNNVEVCLALLTDNKTIFDLLEILNDHSDWIYAHSLGVSLYSTMISRKMGWGSMPTLFKVGTAGLLHDIGKKEIEPKLLNKNRPLLLQEERRALDAHALRGREILENIKELPRDIAQIVYEHHEAFQGQGFPQKLSREQIHPLAKIVGLADRFCNYALVSPHSAGCNAKNALDQINEYYAGHFDPGVFGSLRVLCAST